MLIHIVVQLDDLVKRVSILTIVITFFTTDDSAKVNYLFHGHTSHRVSWPSFQFEFFYVFGTAEAVILAGAFHPVVMAAGRADVEKLGLIRSSS